MDLDDERVFPVWIVVRGQKQPTLNDEVVVGPGERGGIAPGWRKAFVEMGELGEARGGSGCGRGIPGPQMRGTGGTHSLLRERGRGGAGGVDFRGLVEGAGLKDEEGAIGSDGETAIEVGRDDGCRWRARR